MIKIKKLVKNYQSGENVVHALKNITVDINPGECTAIAHRCIWMRQNNHVKHNRVYRQP